MVNKYLALLNKLFLDLGFLPSTSRNISQGIGIVTLFVLSFALFFLVKWLLKNEESNYLPKAFNLNEGFVLKQIYLNFVCQKS